MRKISIIIVTYNSTKHIFECLESIFNYNDIGDGLEVIVVDNSSSEQPGMFRKIKELYGERVLLKDSGKNGGYGFGNNVGVKQSSSETVIVMNPDVRLVMPVFMGIIQEMQEPSVGMLGVKFIDGSLPFYVKLEKITLFNQLVHPLYVKMQKYNEDSMYMSGSFLVFKKDVFIKAGMFDENIFMYTEESDITNRIQKIGYRAMWCPNILVKHLAHGRPFNPKVEGMMNDSKIYYSKKYNVNLKNKIRTIINLLRIKRVVAIIIRDNFRKEQFTKRMDFLLSFYNTLD